MRNRSLIVLAVVTLAVVAAAGYALKTQNMLENAAPTKPAPLFPKLFQHVNDVASITVTTTKNHLTIRRTAPGHWVIVEKDDYPASVDKVKKAVVALAEAKRIQRRTADPKLYKNIGVSSLKTAGSKAAEITLTDGKGKTLAALLIGNTESFSAGATPGLFYVRKPGVKRSWLARGHLENLKPDLLLWITSEIINISRDRIKEVEIAHPGATPIVIRRQSRTTTSVEVSGLPAHAKPELAAAGQVPTALESLSIEDVAKPQGWGFSKAPIATFRTFDGLVIEARTVKRSRKDWVTFAISYAGSPAATTKLRPEASSEKKGKVVRAATYPLKPAAEAQMEAKTLAAAIDGWAFEISGYQAGYFTETAADLTAPTGKKSKTGS
jgi:hypothetical protein